MPVAYTTDTPLTVPAHAFNADGVASLILTGASYGGGYWTINACHGPGDNPTIIGTVETNQTTDPEEAAAAALAWVKDECAHVGLKVAHYVNHSDRYGPAERPYFTTAQVLIVDKDWK